MYPPKFYYPHKIIYLLVLLFKDLSNLLFTLFFLYILPCFHSSRELGPCNFNHMPLIFVYHCLLLLKNYNSCENILPFQQKLKVICDLLPPQACACFSPFEQLIDYLKVDKLQDFISRHFAPMLGNYYFSFRNWWGKLFLFVHLFFGHHIRYQYHNTLGSSIFFLK